MNRIVVEVTNWITYALAFALAELRNQDSASEKQVDKTS